VKQHTVNHTKSAAMHLTETVVADVEEEVDVDGGGRMTTTSR
jgi:hypothetical protein